MGEHTEQFTVEASEPIKIGSLRRLWLLIILVGVAIVASSGVAAYIGYEAGASRTNAQIADLNKSRTQNRAKLQAEQAATLSLICDVLQSLPPSPQIDRDRKNYHCGPYLPPASPGHTPSPRPVPSRSVARGTSAVPRPQPTRTTAPAPRPTPKPTVAPKPTPTPPAPSPSPAPICILFICV